MSTGSEKDVEESSRPSCPLLVSCGMDYAAPAGHSIRVTIGLPWLHSGEGEGNQWRLAMMTTVEP